MTSKQKRELLEIAKLLCKESIVITGRRDDGEPDVCFTKNKEYIFILDKKKSDFFTVDDVGERHFLGMVDEYTRKHFDIIQSGPVKEFGLDEFSVARLNKVYDELHHYS